MFGLGQCFVLASLSMSVVLLRTLYRYQLRYSLCLVGERSLSSSAIIIIKVKTLIIIGKTRVWNLVKIDTIIIYLQNFDLGMSGPPCISIENEEVCVFPVLTVL